MRTFRAVASLLLVCAVLLGACGGHGRPSVAAWQRTWDGVTALMPSADELGSPPDRGRCNEALGELRTASPDLFPTPDPAIEPVVREWVLVAEGALFECPPSSEALPDLASAYDELSRLEAEVGTVLEIDAGS